MSGQVKRRKLAHQGDQSSPSNQGRQGSQGSQDGQAYQGYLSDESDRSGHGDQKDMRAITQIRMVAHPGDPEWLNSSTSGNNWSLYLLISDGEGGGSVRVRMRTTGPGESLGELSFRSDLPYTLPDSAIQYWDFPIIRPSVTVFSLQMAIFENNRHYYRMNKNGLGCRYWIGCVMADFVVAGYIEGNALEDVWRVLQMQYFRSSFPVSLDMAEGKFYVPNASSP